MRRQGSRAATDHITNYHLQTVECTKRGVKSPAVYAGFTSAMPAPTDCDPEFDRMSASQSSASAPRQLFVTTALPYANGSFHIGHIMEYIQADIWVRHQRMLGNTVHFVGADDAHGAPIMLKAEAEGITPDELVARIAELEEERFRLKFRSGTEALEEPLRLRSIRRDIARLKTVQRERQLATRGR